MVRPMKKGCVLDVASGLYVRRNDFNYEKK
jgi:hypothetical protein